MGGCLTEVELYRTYRGEARAEEMAQSLRHIAGCSLCHEQWKRFELDAAVAGGIRSALMGDLRGADETPGVDDVQELPEHLDIPGFRLRDTYIDGGQARVFRAVHVASQEDVAIKVFYNSPLNEGGHARFLRELRSLARLRHPNVIPIRSAGEILGFAYYVMPWITGAPLDEYVRKNPMSTRRKVELLFQIVSAVDHAHKRGVMHLDLKPSNVRIDSAGEPIVMDFGLARMSTGDLADSAVLGLGAAGTPAYMAPEQLEDREDVDTRADVFMLGLLIYEVLAERRAREGSSNKTRRAVDLAQAAPPPLRHVAPHVPRELGAIVNRAIAMDRNERYPSAQALLDDMEAYLHGKPVEAMGQGAIYRLSKFSRQHLAVMVGTLAVLIMLGAGLLVRREMDRYTELAATRATLVSQGLLPAKYRELARAYEELSDLYRRHGDHGLAEEYAIRAEAAMRASTAEPVRRPRTGLQTTPSDDDGAGTLTLP
ncbi:MAG: serine/threonine protein kinase [Phycisphaerales bacterium]|nr:serine/threonine protein kinase [Phycisphaerales bacterium]